MPKDLRSFLETLEKVAPDDLRYVEREVDPRFELTGVLEKLERRGEFPAVWFRKVKGTALPVVANLYASYRRLALALDTSVEAMVEAYARGESRPIPPRFVGSGPVKEVVWTGKDADLTRLPQIVHNARDGGPYISAGVGITRDPDSGRLNCGIYRLQMHGPQQLGWFTNPGQHATHVTHRHGDLGKPMEVVVAVGHHPCFVMAAVSKLQGVGGELDVAGGLLGEPVEQAPAETVNLPVPAHAEVVIEGVVDPTRLHPEGPFGEWPRYYTQHGDRPFIQVTAITMRRDAIFNDIFAAHLDHNVVGCLPRMGSLARRIREVVPSFRAVNLPLSGGGRAHCYISLKKRADGEPKQAAFAAMATDHNLKLVVVVDDDINVYQEHEVLWALATRFEADRDLIMIPNALGIWLLPTAYDATRNQHGVMNTKLILDATKPMPPAPFPEMARVPPEVVDAIDLDKYFRPSGR